MLDGSRGTGRAIVSWLGMIVLASVLLGGFAGCCYLLSQSASENRANNEREGMEAEDGGVPPEACPHADATKKEAWLKGWNRSRIERTKGKQR